MFGRNKRKVPKDKRPTDSKITGKIPKEKIPKEKIPKDRVDDQALLVPKKQKLKNEERRPEKSKIIKIKPSKEKGIAKSKIKDKKPQSSQSRSPKLIKPRSALKEKKEKKHLPRSDKLRPSKRKDGVRLLKSKKKDSPKLRKDGIQKALLVENRALQEKQKDAKPGRSPSLREDIKDKRMKEKIDQRKEKEAPLTKVLAPVEKEHKKLKQKVPKDKVPKAKRPR
ncbi:MAG: hypothetical protein ACXAD7_06695 [Candidatus Kariarchaeaceae archaeon]|jgi:hypothetical protein